MPGRVPALANKRERLAITRLYVELSHELRESVFRGKDGDADVGTLLLVGCAVVVGHAEGRPMNASKIAGYVALPRTTVLRKLNRLMELEAVARRGRNYFVAPQRAGTLPLDKARIARAIASAFEFLV
jgi:hypothetical protein